MPLALDMAGLSDGDLARRIMDAPSHSGPEETALCARYVGRLRLYGRRHLGDASRAADLAQQVLVITLEHLRAGSIREPSQVGSFMLGTARRVAWSVVRQGRVAPPEDQAGGAGTEADAAPDPWTAGRLSDCLQALSHRERAVLALTFYEGATAAEVSRRLSLSEGNTRVIRHRALGRLRSCVGADDDG